jgi:hypothetical protein
MALVNQLSQRSLPVKLCLQVAAFSAQEKLDTFPKIHEQVKIKEPR